MRALIGTGVFALPLTAIGCATAQPAVTYEVDLSRAATQIVTVSATAPAVDGVAEFVLPVWRPGRYGVLDFAATVREWSATDSGGNPVDASKIRKNAWRITGLDDGEPATLTYDIFAASLGDRTRHADDSHAYLSGSSVFVMSPPHRDAEHTVRLTMPGHWRVATGMERDGDRYVAPSYDALMDSPIEAGEHQLHVFDAEGVRTEVVVWGDVEPDWDEVKRDFTAIAEVTHDVFDHDIHIDRYVYIVHAYPGGRGGTEHLNSTVVQTRPETFSDHDRWIGFMGLVTHEYFHTWNVKRFRPVGITPYDYDKENYTTLLWLVEGTTSYYDELLLVRAGIVDADWYIDRTASTIGSVMNRAGRHRSSLSQSSYDAWLKFWGQPSPDHSNTTVNFYSHGSMASMCLDLMIRDATDNARSLDDVMRVLNERYDWRENGYTPGDVRAIAAEVAGTDMAEFFDRYIDGTEPPPFAEALAIAGLELTQDDADGPPTLGASINGAGEVTRLRDGSPAFAAGINVGDEVVSIAGRSVAGRDTGDVLAEFEPGDAVTVGLFRYRAYREIELELGEPAPGRYRLERVAEPTERQRRIYEGWLGESWPFETTD